MKSVVSNTSKLIDACLDYSSEEEEYSSDGYDASYLCEGGDTFKKVKNKKDKRKKGKKSKKDDDSSDH